MMIDENDKKISQLLELTSPLLTDILPIVSDPTGIPISKKVTVATLLSSLNSGYMTLPNPNYLSGSAVTFTGINLNPYFVRGVKVRWHQDGVYKYGYVLTSSFSGGNTILQIVVTTSGSFANSTIDDFKISYGNPADFPGWFGYTVVPTGFTGAITFGYNRFNIENRACNLRVDTIDGTSNSTSLTFNLPVPASLNSQVVGYAYAIDNNTIYPTPQAYISVNGSTATAFLSYYTTPWTASNRKAIIAGIMQYEI